MKIAVLCNSPDSAEPSQHRGTIAHEIYPQRNIDRVVVALEQRGHQVEALEADRHVIERLGQFFGHLREGQWPGLVFNLAFGIQGQLRYCHMPGLLEMLGLPYLGSGPLGHALATDKAAAKAVWLHAGLPTPGFVVFDSTDTYDPGLGFPLIVKPVAQASSLGLRLVNDLEELHAAVAENLEIFQESVMAERFIGGREINVSVLGNAPPQALPVVEVLLGKNGLPVYTREDKDGTAQRELKLVCPAALPADLTDEAQRLAIHAFTALGCRDWARVEFRIDEVGQLQIIEINTIPGLGAISSLPAAAAQAGMPDFPSLVQRLVDIAVERYHNQPPGNFKGPRAVKQ
jgi:D-alanine-D-alanine ligase